jgi:hypothetical protein
MVEVLIATAMDQRDGVTAVTATRYPFGSREERRGRRTVRGRARRGAVGVRRHAVTAVIRCAPQLARCSHVVPRALVVAA